MNIFSSLPHTLYLASASRSRQQLLKGVGIPFKVLHQTADEKECDWSMPLEKLVAAIAEYKMEHVVLPDGKEGERIFVVTADTLGSDINGTVYGKPENRDDAVRMIRTLSEGGRGATGMCVERKVYSEGEWVTEKQLACVVTADYIFDLPDRWLDAYLSLPGVLEASGALIVEGFGALFLKEIAGSVSGITGLPLCELRQLLERLDFFDR